MPQLAIACIMEAHISEEPWDSFTHPS